jgi:hypothetical protein
MNITVQRQWFTEFSTCGAMLLDGRRVAQPFVEEYILGRFPELNVGCSILLRFCETVEGPPVT